MTKVQVEDQVDHESSDTPPSSPGTGRRLHRSVAHTLGTAILSGEYAPGHTFSGEIEFSKTLHVSRTTYREAIQVLIGKGLVETRPKIGTRILPRSRWNLLDPDVLAWSCADGPDIDFIHNLFELRAIVEPAAAAFAALRRDRSDLKAMKDSLAGMRRHTLATEAGRTADRDFHAAILHATRNDALIVLSTGVGVAVGWTTQFKQYAPGLPRNSISDHVRVYDEIAAGDPARASGAMRTLVELALQDTKLAMAHRLHPAPHDS